MLGTRTIYLDGWRAYAPWQTLGKQITPKDLDNAKWMLFNINEDFSESTDMATSSRTKLAELKQLWFMQASKYLVLPPGRQQRRAFGDAAATAFRAARQVRLLPEYRGSGSRQRGDVRNRSYSIAAEVEIPKGGAEGVLIAHGSSFGGYTFFVKDGHAPLFPQLPGD